MGARRASVTTFAAALAAALCISGQPALSFHTDIHYVTQAALALASDWPVDDAMWIAGADEAVDRNEPTVAGLENNTLQMTTHQATKNYEYHCFSRVDDSVEARKDLRNAEVEARLDDLKHLAKDAVALSKNNATATAEGQRRRIEALVAIGVYFHCQQDSWSHSGYGAHAFGHAFDDVFPGTPDHPADRPAKTAKALVEALSVLHEFAQVWRPDQAPNDARLTTLLSGLTDRSMLFDQSCVNVWPRYWLFQDLQKSGRLTNFIPQNLPATRVCGGLHQRIFKVAGADARVVQFTAAKFPLLDISARPRFDAGQPRLVTAGGFDHTVPQASGTSASPSPTSCNLHLSTTVANLGPQTSQPAKVAMAVLSGPNTIDWYGEKELGPMTPNQQQPVVFDIRSSRRCSPQMALVTNVQPQAPLSNDAIWGDRDARNNRRVVRVTPRPAVVAVR